MGEKTPEGRRHVSRHRRRQVAGGSAIASRHDLAEERQLLYGLARDYYRGEGVIVDAGIFLGASTTAFGRGLRDNPTISADTLPAFPIRAFERGIAGPNLVWHTKRAGLKGVPVGDSFETVLRQQLEPMTDLTKLNVGDIRDYTGDDLDAIEICFLDILKTPEVARHAMRAFYPKMIPGAIVIQQDYFFSDLPHIRVFNEALSDKLRYLGEVRSSGVFEVMETISEDELEDALSALDTLDRSIPLHKRAEARTVNPVRQYLLRLSRGLLYATAHDVAMAEETLAEANRQFSDIAFDAPGRYASNMDWRVARLQRAIGQARVVAERRAARVARKSSGLRNGAAPSPESPASPGKEAEGQTSSQRFVILAHTRTGSYHLVSLLNSHPEIDCHGEILQPVGPPFLDHVAVIEDMDKRFHDPSYRREHYEEFLDAFYRTTSDILGYKLIVTQHNAALVQAIMDPAIRVIYLYRENILAVYSSEQIAKRTGLGRAKAGTEVARANALFDRAEFMRRCGARTDRHELYMEILKRSGRDFFLLEYNEIVLPEKQRALLAFLGASPDVALTSEYTKRNSSDIVSRFSNSDDVLAYLQEIDRPDWAAENISR